jgi:anti-sigma factor RsiW
MTRMDCGEVRELLQSFADDELPNEERQAVAQHLQACRECGATLAELQALRQRIKAAKTFAMPAGFDQSIKRAIGLEDRQGAATWGRFPAMAASHIAALALGALVAYGVASRIETRAGISREIVTAHVRSLLTEQIIQVASADTHTVKPWFMGKITYAPDVVDLNTQEFPLIGGRVDYVLDRPVAAIVYGRRKHRINLFVLPADQVPGTAEIQSTRNGYNVLGWRQGAFAYFAASDLNAPELQEFASALRNRTPQR